VSDWWDSAPLVTSRGSGDEWWKNAPLAKDPGAESAAQPSWQDVAISAVGNAPGSALRFAKDVAQPFVHPLDTAAALGRTANALEDKVMSSIGVSRAPGFELSAQDQAIPGQIAQYYGGRYGDVEKIKKSVAEDPVGVLGDVSTALSLGGTAAARVPGLIGKTGRAAAKLGDVANPAMAPMKAVASVGNQAAKFVPTVAAPTTEALYEAATAAYDDPAIKNVAVKPSAFKTWKDTLLATNDVVDEDLSPKTFNILKRLDTPPSGSFFDGRSIQSLRRKLGQAAGATDPTERKAASDAIESLDNFLGGIPEADVLRGDPTKMAEALALARGNYAAAKRSALVESKLYNAGLQAGSANSGMNLDNATRQRIKDLVRKDKQGRSEAQKKGFTNQEIDRMASLIGGGVIENTARRVGNVLGGGGGLGNLASIGAGALVGGASGHAELGAILAGGAGYALKRVSSALTQADAHRLQELVRSRSPLGQQMQSSLGKFGKAITALKGAPSAKTIARFMLASRNLSTNLIDAGINITPESIAGAAGGE
jgi:hypothetical protein